MRIANSRILLPVFLAAVLAAPACRPLFKEVLRPPKVRVADIFLASPPAGGPGQPWALTLTLEVENPNPFALRVVHVAYSMAVEEQTVAEGERSEELEIAPSAATAVTVPVSLSPDAFAAAARQIFARRALRYEFHGSVALRAPLAGAVRIPFSRAGSFDAAEILKRKPLGIN